MLNEMELDALADQACYESGLYPDRYYKIHKRKQKRFSTFKQWRVNNAMRRWDKQKKRFKE